MSVRLVRLGELRFNGAELRAARRRRRLHAALWLAGALVTLWALFGGAW